VIIKNKEINLLLGDKEFRFTNYITDSYLHKYAVASFGGAVVDSDYKVLELCKIKFVGDADYSIELNSDFLSSTETNKEIASTNKITTKYNYYYTGDWADHIGETIAEIGFFTADTVDVLAYLDVSNSNITIQAGQEIIINRVDEITTEAVFYSTDLTYPSHLSAITGTFEDGVRKYATVLASIGLGIVPNKMSLEVLYADIPNIYIDFDFGGEAGKYIFYPFGADKGYDLFPSDTLFPSDDLFPQAPEYHYVLYKYKLMNYVGSTWVDTGKWYYQSYPFEIVNDILITAKIERSA
jgi:hypothetical protein